MLSMILKMTLSTALYVIVTVVLWKKLKTRDLSAGMQVLIGLIFGTLSVLSTHFGINYGHMLVNVRDIGPLSAGLFFHPVSGIIAGLIGGIERYIAGTYWGVGSYTRIACGLSTCLAGFVSMLMSIFIFKRQKPGPAFAFFMGAVMEVFHMYVVLITHRDDIDMAYYVVKTCSLPMILFTGLGLSVSSALLLYLSGELTNPFKPQKPERLKLTDHFQHWLFVVIVSILAINFVTTYITESQRAIQEAKDTLLENSSDIAKIFNKVRDNEVGLEIVYYYTSEDGIAFDIFNPKGSIIEGNHKFFAIKNDKLALVRDQDPGTFFEGSIFYIRSLCLKTELEDDFILLVQYPLEDVFAERNISMLEMLFSDILLIAGIYVLISFLVQKLVVNNLDLVNASLKKITGGDLNEVVEVRSSSEFANLSDDINSTVNVLKGYIDAAEKRIEEELILAKTIQDSALPRNFDFPRKDFELYALMDPAKEVGGDFYDFFFLGRHTFALVIADVSGKGIPASLFMMRSKAEIRNEAEKGKSPSEILTKVNNDLCEGNDAEMFVTVWIGIVDLRTGHVVCSNAGHEWPLIKRKNGEFELFKDKHSLAIAAMPNIKVSQYELQLEPGDRLFVYTDGVPEAVNEKLEQYDTDRLLRVINEEKDRPMKEILPKIREDINSFAGSAEQFDDITMLGFTYFGEQEDKA